VAGLPIILLTRTDPPLVAALRASGIGFDLAISDSDVPSDIPSGPLFAFVDWMLPDLSGLELCARLRNAAATEHGHITMILASRDDQARRRALHAGADDYIAGPLTAAHITGKILASRGAGASAALPSKLVHGDLTVDLQAFRVRYKKRNVAMPANEFRLLISFIENSDRLLTRKTLIEMLGKESHLMDSRNVNVWVGRLRRLLIANGVPDPIRTVRSLGYVMDSV
jgi:two-component system, OmpR family, phosphate regulon response regulator PhoB